MYYMGVNVFSDCSVLFCVLWGVKLLSGMGEWKVEFLHQIEYQSFLD